MSKSKNQKPFIALYIILIVIDIVISLKRPDLRIITKPLIVGSLLYFFFRQQKRLDKGLFRLAFTALALSLMGDILLLFEENGELFFIGGLGAFLLAHLFYCIVFIHHWNKKTTAVFGFILVGLLAYAVSFFMLLKPNLGELFIPVAVYILVILTMMVTALKRQGKTSRDSFVWVSTGALLFVISDSLLAVNKFLTELPAPVLWIMSTYAFAQLFIAFGLLKHRPA